MTETQTPEQKMLNYLLGEKSELHPMFGGTPNIRDICFNVFLLAKSGKNDDDGGSCDWGNDTVKLVEKAVTLVEKKLAEWKAEHAIQLGVAESSPIAAPAQGSVINWVAITNIDDLPKKPGKVGYEQIDCLIVHEGEVLRRMWNCEHGVWDDEDGDDYFCDPLDPTFWAEFPKPPTA